MKRILVIIFAATGLALAASAQPRALGVRTGAIGIEMSYQHTMQQRSFKKPNLAPNSESTTASKPQAPTTSYLHVLPGLNEVIGAYTQVPV